VLEDFAEVVEGRKGCLSVMPSSDLTLRRICTGKSTDVEEESRNRSWCPE